MRRMQASYFSAVARYVFIVARRSAVPFPSFSASLSISSSARKFVGSAASAFT